MPRSRRIIPPDSVLHVLNRGNDRRPLFRSPAEYGEFAAIMQHAVDRVPLRILAWVLMPNHWHLVVWPESGTQVSRYLHLLCTEHAARWRRRAGTVGEGHVYQGRYHAFVVESERQYFNLLRYVEANPVRAGLVRSAITWPWSSLVARQGDDSLLSAGPLALPAQWPALVDQAIPAEVLADFRRRSKRSHRPAWQPDRVRP